MQTSTSQDMTFPETKTDFDLISTLRYDPEPEHVLELHQVSTGRKEFSYGEYGFYMLQYHYNRLLIAAQYFKWSAAITKLGNDATVLQDFLHDQVSAYQLAHGSREPLRIRLLLSRTGNLSTTLTPTPPLLPSILFPITLCPQPIESSASTPVPLHVDHAPTPPTPHTRHKTTSRTAYDLARSRTSIPTLATPAEVLLHNLTGQVTEGSLTSVYFFRGGQWVTPPVDSGGQEGTTRKWALDRGLCAEGVVEVASLKEGERCWISNGVRGWREAKLVFGPYQGH